MVDAAPPRREISAGDDDATRPLLAPQNSGAEQEPDENASRRQFGANRREAAQSAVLHRDTWASASSRFLLCLGGLGLLAVPIIIIYVEVRSWYVLFANGDLQCDQNLALWLLVRNMLTWAVPRTPDPNSDLTPEELSSLRARARLGASFSIGWLAVGCVWTFQAKTCPHTNPELFMWVRFLTFFGAGVLLMTTSLPLIVLLVVISYHGMVNRGWIKSPNAASDGAIERLQSVPFQADLFHQDGERSPGGTSRPPKECCCCMEDFADDKAIVRTPCGHYYHRDCLQEWFRLARSCPLCRCDLDEPSVASMA